MISLYYFGFTLLLCIAGPFLLLHKKARAGLVQKLGVVPDYVKAGKTRAGNELRIWIHAVSVGEFNAVHPLIQALRTDYPSAAIFVSTTTATGQKLAHEKIGDFATVFYFPFDLPWALNSWLDAIAPHMVVIAETEIWPGFTHEAAKRGIQLCCVNGRISPRSFKGYQRFDWFFSTVLSKFAALGVQTEEEAQRYIALGGRTQSIHVNGNLKFDGLKKLASDEQARLREKLCLNSNDRVIVAGSTHEGEETPVLEALRQLRTQFKNGDDSHGDTRLIIAPRHPERFERVCQVILDAGFTVRRYSLDDVFVHTNDVYVLDTIGQLNNYYAVADIAFVGGTIAPIGGHSLIEPYVYGIPVVCGPHTEKTKDIARGLLAVDAMVQAHDGAAVTKALVAMAQSPETRKRRGLAGQKYIMQGQGAVKRTVGMLAGLFPATATKESKAAVATGDRTLTKGASR